MDVATCPTCNTPLDVEKSCVTCSAEAEGLRLISRSGYSSVKEMMELLESEGLAPAMDQVPPRRPEEVLHPLWNLYVPEAEVGRAAGTLEKDWIHLVEDPAAIAAAARGLKGVDLDAGGEIECPACGHRFLASAAQPECPDCGLALGAPSDSAPDEAET
ncbi:MAG TPA: hypothetical protein VMK42_05730 [Anaeromyxobacteraceae bacterium]|nr:hypothetical protein [Anaeromyxobacteraceae bacterium]